MTTSIFEPHILQNLRLHLDMKLLGNSLAHAMHLTLAAGTRLLIVGEVILDTLAWQVFRQRSASTLLSRLTFYRWQAGVRKLDNIAFLAAIFDRNLFGLVEEAINVLFAAGCKAMQAAKVGRNAKRQINLFDPDGTRVEVMEPTTADGKPVPPSTAPVPTSQPHGP